MGLTCPLSQGRATEENTFLIWRFITELLELVAVKLFVIIQYDGVWHTITTNDALYTNSLIFAGVMDGNASASTHLVK